MFKIDPSRRYVMSIVNVTPDSFYEGSRTPSAAAVEERIRRVVAEGADIIDIGGYSTRPGSVAVSTDEEWRRVDTGLAAARRIAPDMPLSLDTFRGEIVRRAYETYGEFIVNDVTSGETDDSIIDAAAEYSLTYVATHNRPEKGDIAECVAEYFRAKCAELQSRGVRSIIIDPGFGFSKSAEDNFALMRGLHRLCGLGFPVLSGISRKRMIWQTLSSSPAEALAGTVALNWESLRQGASIIRVHDTREAADIVRIFDTFERMA